MFEYIFTSKLKQQKEPCFHGIIFLEIKLMYLFDKKTWNNIYS